MLIFLPEAARGIQPMSVRVGIVSERPLHEAPLKLRDQHGFLGLLKIR